jgi:GTP diphosphokinase / guanosine-3',5'-bis(diphosphate) 3'-diphosphatase
MDPIHGPNRKEFFDKVKEKITDDRLITCIEVAYNIAKEAHRPQKRDDGSRYFEHVKMVAWIILTEVNINDQFRLTILVCTALLHDLMEDTYIAQKRHLHFIFDQVSQDIAIVSWELTKPKKTECNNDPWQRLLSSTKVPTKLVKAADRLHNVRTLSRCKLRKIHRKINETREVILPWLRDNNQVNPAHGLYIQEIDKLSDKIEQELQKLEAVLAG